MTLVFNENESLKEKSHYTSDDFEKFGSSKRVILWVTKYWIFLIFGNLSLDDFYKFDSYKKKCVRRRSKMTAKMTFLTLPPSPVTDCHKCVRTLSLPLLSAK